MSEVKYMDIKEFREKGFLQEANRLFFHPLGLALEIRIDEEGNEFLGGVWDYRDDQEGMLFGDLTKQIHADKAENIIKLAQEKGLYRTAQFGWNIQPIGNKQGEYSMNGISIRLYTRKDELTALKQGASTLIAYPTQDQDNSYEISVSLDACDFVGDQVRVNTALLNKVLDDLGVQFGAAMGKELEKIFKELE